MPAYIRAMTFCTKEEAEEIFLCFQENLLLFDVEGEAEGEELAHMITASIVEVGLRHVDVQVSFNKETIDVLEKPGKHVSPGVIERVNAFLDAFNRANGTRGLIEWLTSARVNVKY